MIKILVDEDDAGKLQRIASVLEESQVPLEAIDECRDAAAAKRLLQATSYDLLVLDIAIPERMDRPVSTEGGLNLLAEICQRSLYRRPQHIAIVTGYTELEQRVRDRFPAERWRVISYDPSSDSWVQQLQAQVQHISAARAAEEGLPAEHHADVVIVCAVNDVELESVLRIPWDWEVAAVPHDGTVYWKGHLSRSNGNWLVYAASAPRMGLTWSGVLATKMIASFRPRFIIMSGICAGISGRAQIGDVIVAESSWDYGSGKHEVKGDRPVFSLAPHQLPMDLPAGSKVRLLARDHQALATIRAKWPGNKPLRELRIQVGPVASGAGVIADPIKVSEIEDQNRKVIGIDMESYAIFAAAADSYEPRPIALSIKGVSDLANEEKDDKSQAYAAYVSAEVVRLLVEKYL